MNRSALSTLQPKGQNKFEKTPSIPQKRNKEDVRILTQNVNNFWFPDVHKFQNFIVECMRSGSMSI